jgi:hypothetical protein
VETELISHAWRAAHGAIGAPACWNRDWARLPVRPSSLYARAGASTGPGPRSTHIKV